MNNGQILCVVCYQKQREQTKRDKVHEIVGENCWICDYGGKEKRQVLDFHHIDRSAKKFALHTRNIANLSWKSVTEEIRKCCLLCCRCHREVECRILADELVVGVYEKKWQEINGS